MSLSTKFHADLVARLEQGLSIQRTADLLGIDRRTTIRLARELGWSTTGGGYFTQRPGVTPMNLNSTDAAKANLLGAVNIIRKVAEDHPDTKIRKQADRTLEQVQRLANLVNVYEDAAEARAEIARLEQELAEAKRKLKPQKLHAVPVDAKAIRAWAAANDVACPARGPLPASVVEAYQAAS